MQLTVNEVDEMIALGDIDFDKYRRIANATFPSATDAQIKEAIGMQQDDDDDEFKEHLKTLVAA